METAKGGEGGEGNMPPPGTPPFCGVDGGGSDSAITTTRRNAPATLLERPHPGVEEAAVRARVSGSKGAGSAPVAAHQLHASSASTSPPGAGEPSAANVRAPRQQTPTRPGTQDFTVDGEANSASSDVSALDTSAPAASPSPQRTRHLATSNMDTDKGGASEDESGDDVDEQKMLMPPADLPCSGGISGSGGSNSAALGAKTEDQGDPDTRGVSSSIINSAIDVTPFAAPSAISRSSPSPTVSTVASGGETTAATLPAHLGTLPQPDPDVADTDSGALLARLAHDTAPSTSPPGGGDPTAATVRVPAKKPLRPGMDEVTVNEEDLSTVPASNAAAGCEGTRVVTTHGSTLSPCPAGTDAVNPVGAAAEAKAKAKAKAESNAPKMVFETVGTVCSEDSLRAEGEDDDDSELELNQERLKEQVDKHIEEKRRKNREETLRRNEELAQQMLALEREKYQSQKQREAEYHKWQLGMLDREMKLWQQEEELRKQSLEELQKKSEKILEQKMALEHDKHQSQSKHEIEYQKWQEQVLKQEKERWQEEEADNRRNLDEVRKKAEELFQQKIALQHEKMQAQLKQETEHQQWQEEILLRERKVWEEEAELNKQNTALTNREESLRSQLRAAMEQFRELAMKLRADAADRLEDYLPTVQRPLLGLSQHLGLMATAKDDNVWNKRQSFLGWALVSSLTVLFSIEPYLPPTHRIGILRGFSLVWLSGSVVFLSGLFGKSMADKDFARHVSRFTFMAFALFVQYAIYLLSLSTKDTTSQPCLPALAPSPDSARSDQQGDELFYIFSGLFGIAAFVCLWWQACRTGGDKDE